MTRSLLAGLALTAVGFFALASAPVEVGAEGPAASSSSVSSVVSAPTASGYSAQVLSDEADALSATFIGFVHRDAEGRLAMRVMASGLTERGEAVNCGTSSVTALDGGFGFYRVLVLGDTAREGCPRLGEPVSFRLLFGNIDDGVRAETQNDTTFLPGATSVATLHPTGDRSIVDRWTGERTGNSARLTWHGATTPAADAFASLGRPIARAWQWDAAAGRFLVYVPGGPALLQSLAVVSPGDTISVRFE